MATPMAQYLSEFIATAMLILLGNGVVAGALLNQSKAQGAGWGVITAAWGLAVLIGICIAGPTSGAIMNPALTIGLAAIGKLAWALVPGFVIAQIAGAFVGATLVWLTYLAHWRASDDPELKRAIFCTSPAIRDTKANVLTEVIGTFALTFGALAIGANSFAPGLGPLGVGLLVVVIGMSLGGPTGYAINPARDLGPRLAHALLPIAGKGSSDWGYAWVPVVAPIVGAVLGAFAFQAVYG
ncbi:MIP/aquaporin family protein [Lysobacter enzymogenes]|uniref:MIP/aquaporin family protein n=1 Tax=Lysobacter enzymogenes TaxID=69 RepID=UPI001F520A7D|nr:MIP/aquaporin family protein [Lysobacter enzymogenes]UZW59893.1 aquaporin family protein [Lysobacter enzymogenes]